MTDRPIIFSAAMVRALLDGRKSQTRRVLNPPYGTLEYLRDGTWKPICTKFFPGDRLYVREAWRTEARFDDRKPLAVPPGEWIWFEAQDDVPFEPSAAGRLRPGMFMPRWASRITLTVTEVRVQRLQEISEDDAVAEGIKLHSLAGLSGWTDYATVEAMAKRYFADPRKSYASLWNSLHGPEAWGANPWVVAVSFIPHLTNIDAPYLEMTDLPAGNLIARNIPVGMTGKVLCPVITAAL